MSTQGRRRRVLADLVAAGMAAIDPRRLVREAIDPGWGEAVSVIAIGKAAPLMCRGLADVLPSVDGICISAVEAPVPQGIELVVGDHPVPGDRSFAAGARALEVARVSKGRCVALISGGGSALCEVPRPGITEEYLGYATRVLLDAGAPIDEINLVRRHLSQIKGGGLAAATQRPFETYVISDVGGRDPGLVASGPTIHADAQPDLAIAAMIRVGLEPDPSVLEAIRRPLARPSQGRVQVLADGRTAGSAVVDAARSGGIDAKLLDGWVRGTVEDELDAFLLNDDVEMIVAVGEPSVRVDGNGRGGRCTHTALLAARAIEGTPNLFAAVATDGVDGRSASAGAVVDGATTERGGDPRGFLDRSDSATYLATTGDLLESGFTGTNVADLWILWR